MSKVIVGDDGTIDPKLPERRPRRAAYALPTFFTAGNIFLGYISVIQSFRGAMLAASGVVGAEAHFELAAKYIGLAVFLDGLDGRIARMTHTTSDFGRELDSLADVISFGVAPAALGYAAGLRGAWDWAALVYFVCCGVSRLARYNVTAEQLSGAAGKVAYFEGTPIPTSIVLTGVLALAAWSDRLGQNIFWGVWSLAGAELHPLSLLFVVSGTLMISKTLHIPKL